MAFQQAGGAWPPDEVAVAASVLSADPLRLGDELASVSDADLIHFDVMDGHFVPNLTYGPDVLRAVAASTGLPVDAHLMLTNPDEVAADYARAGAAVVTFHMEAQRHALRIVDAVHDAGALAGVAINPGTAVGSLGAIIGVVDLVLVMSVNPGFGGQRFIEGTYDQLRALRALCDERGVSPVVEVDGGVFAGNAGALCAAGARVLVAGSAIFGAPERGEAVSTLRAAGRRGMLRHA